MKGIAVARDIPGLSKFANAAMFANAAIAPGSELASDYLYKR